MPGPAAGGAIRAGIAATLLAVTAIPDAALAQAAAPVPAPAPPVAAVTPAQVGQRATPAVDPVRLAAARPVIDQIFPQGTYARAMRAALDQLTQMAADQLSGNGRTPPDPAAPGAAVRAALADVSAAEDPYAAERSRIVLRVVSDEMSSLMASFEPGVRDALTKAYARRFTVDQLTTLHAFFETPTGQAYARESVAITMGPDMVEATQAILPKIVEAMPGIMAKAETATKDLPPPPKHKRK